MISLSVGSSLYEFNFSDLADTYRELTSLSDRDFLDRAAEAAHFACFVSALKGPSSAFWACYEGGIVHELIHVLHLGEAAISVSHLRQLFAEQCDLSFKPLEATT